MVNWAYAANGAAGAESAMWTFIVPMVVMVGIFYFFLIRPQQKKGKEHKALLNDLKRGDRVITNGGIIGTIISVDDQIINLEVADRVKIEVAKAYIAGFAPKKS